MCIRDRPHCKVSWSTVIPVYHTGALSDPVPVADTAYDNKHLREHPEEPGCGSRTRRTIAVPL